MNAASVASMEAAASVAGSSSEHSDPYDWGLEDIVSHLSTPGVGLLKRHPTFELPHGFVDALRAQKMTGDTLLDLTEDDWIALSFEDMSPRRRMMEFVKSLSRRSHQHQELLLAREVERRDRKRRISHRGSMSRTSQDTFKQEDSTASSPALGPTNEDRSSGHEERPQKSNKLSAGKDNDLDDVNTGPSPLGPANETFVRTASGQKRRRLQLDHPTSDAVKITSMEEAVSSTSGVVEPILMRSDGNFHQPSEHSMTYLPTPVHDRQARNQIMDSNEPPSHQSVSYPLRQQHSERDNVRARRSRSQMKPRNRTASQQYLGHMALPLKEIFYGSSPLGEEIHLQEPSSFFREAPDDPESDTWVFSTRGHFPRGLRSYVGNRLKFSMLTSPRSYSRGSRTYQGRTHYPKSLKPEQADVTLFIPTPEGIIARRADASNWTPSSNPLTTDATLELLSEGKEEKAIGIEKVDDIGSDQEYLRHWLVTADGRLTEDVEPDLPYYGESGSENDFDSELLDEMDAEGTRQGQRVSTSLGPEKMLAIIQDHYNITAAQWQVLTLPKIQNKARRLWIKVRREGTKRIEMERLSKAVSESQRQLDTFSKAILEDVWWTEDSLRKQCMVLESTIENLEKSNWELSMIRARHAPEKVNRLKRLDKPIAQAIPGPGGVDDDEEDLKAESLSSGTNVESEDNFIELDASYQARDSKLDYFHYEDEADDLEDLANLKETSLDTSAKDQTDEVMANGSSSPSREVLGTD